MAFIFSMVLSGSVTGHGILHRARIPSWGLNSPTIWRTYKLS